jgi:hypothetical protein
MTAHISQLLNPPLHPGALLACALIFFLNCFWLTPRINQARDDGKLGAFKALQWASVALNMVQLFVFVWMLVPTGAPA